MTFFTCTTIFIESNTLVCSEAKFTGLKKGPSALCYGDSLGAMLKIILPEAQELVVR